MSKELGNTSADKNYQPSGITRAEEIALEKYPHNVYGGTLGDSLRAACMVGYHQAEKDLADKAKYSSGMDGFYYGHGYRDGKKDTIERAVKWLQEHANEYIVDIAVETYPDAPQKLVVGGMCWVYMKLALEGEE